MAKIFLNLIKINPQSKKLKESQNKKHKLQKKKTMLKHIISKLTNM